MHSSQQFDESQDSDYFKGQITSECKRNTDDYSPSFWITSLIQQYWISFLTISQTLERSGSLLINDKLSSSNFLFETKILNFAIKKNLFIIL